MFTFGYCLIFIAIFGRCVQTTNGQASEKCTSKIYCVGELPKTLLLSGLFSHPKDFVDQKMLYDTETILKNFERLVDSAEPDKPSDTALETFVKENFAKDTLNSCNLTDFTEDPPVLDAIVDDEYKKFAKDVNNIWLQLTGQVDIDVQKNPDKYSYIYLPHCFVKASVNFFVESYYWDSHWIMEGLIESGMLETYKGMLKNMFEIVDNYGQMLNGNRIYYMGRAQPPFLTMMAKKYEDATHDHQFIQDHLSQLTKEFEWWLENRSVKFKYKGVTFEMYRYYQDNPTPRPEGFNYDWRLAHQETVSLTEQQKNDLYVEIRSTAESGFDFGTRFMREGKYVDTINRLNLDTSQIIPVDLNCLLEYSARQLNQWHQLYGTQEDAKKYKDISDRMKENIEKVLRHEEDKIWYDFSLHTKKPNRKFVTSNLTPLYTDSIMDTHDKSTLGNEAAEYLHREGFIDQNYKPVYSCIPITKTYSLEQWDLPNCWAPAMSIVIEGLKNSGGESAIRVADNLAKLWIKINYLGFVKSNREYLYEKYDAYEMGTAGGGGTYVAPVGFGWTNGFLLKLLRIYGKDAQHTDFADFQPPSRPNNESVEELKKQRWDRREYLLRNKDED